MQIASETRGTYAMLVSTAMIELSIDGENRAPEISNTSTKRMLYGIYDFSISV